MENGNRKLAKGEICVICPYVTSIGYNEHVII